MNKWFVLAAGCLILAVMRTDAVPLDENKGGEKLEEVEAEEHKIVKRSDESDSSEEFGRRRVFFAPQRRSFISPQPRVIYPQVRTSQIFYPFSLSRNDFSQRNSNRRGPIYRSGFPGQRAFGNYYYRRGDYYQGGRGDYYSNGYYNRYPNHYYGKHYQFQYYNYPYYNEDNGYGHKY